MKFVIYSGNHEVLVTTKKKEAKLIEECFGKTGDRDLEDYDRDESVDIAVCVTSGLKVDW